ncbi:putative universal stress protein [Mycobacterium xenopi 4042]|uniref:Putative universal stress protein n=1 Tax=Mycobacterium xenopi 4042 TaxID=1299334 RepID=X7YQH2_MYCXE|nr:putative universal stress protein [Mycobacterium xenopi 4042]
MRRATGPRQPVRRTSKNGRSSVPRRRAGRTCRGGRRRPAGGRQRRIEHDRRPLLGSVPANVSRRAKTDVLIVHTTP